MTESFLSDGARTEGARRLARLVGVLAEEINGAPAFGEFLETLSVAVPARGESLSRLPVPLHLKAKTKGNRRYVCNRKSRVAELNDAVFVEASDFLSFLDGEARTTGSRDVTAGAIVSGILQILKQSVISFEDVSSTELVSLEPEMPKRTINAKRGDVVAIPSDGGSYHLAVVLVARNRFGTALGILRGKLRFPRIGGQDRYQARARPLYVDDHLIRNGAWPIVDHVDGLLSLFPDEPEIYHAPDQLWPGDQAGEFGSAESPSGGLRQIDKEEAEEVGLLSGAYRQVYVSGHLQQLLASEI